MGAGVSAHALAVLKGKPSTYELHTVENADGSRSYTPERAKIHAQIIASFLSGKRPNPSGTPQTTFLAGGPASGKSTLRRGHSELLPEDPVVVDPDEVKRRLPEFAALVGDPHSGSGTHYESSDIAHELYLQARKRGLDMIVDGAGNSSERIFADKIRQTGDAGYRTRVLYADAPVEVALERAERRRKSEGRATPEAILRNLHRGVSQRFGEVLEYAGADEVLLFDTGTDKEAIPVYERKDGRERVLDSARFKAFKEKGQSW